MMRNERPYFNILFLFCAVMIWGSVGCGEIFEKDLAPEDVFVIMPADNLETDLTSQTFWWEPVDGAVFYNLQVVSPSFDSIMRLLVDTTLQGDKLTLSLYPGSFQWRLRAFNSSSSTEYFVRSLTINNTFDLSDQQVVPINPVNNLATNQSRINFRWYRLTNATDYRFELKYGNWDGDYAVNPILTGSDSISLELMEGTFSWGVQGQNENSASVFTIRSLVIDTTSPSIPVPILPAINDTVTDTEVEFTWERPDLSGSMIRDSLLVSSDSLFSAQGMEYSYYTDQTEFTATLNATGSFFWKVRSIDAAGNKSDFSQVRKFYRTDEK